ncbi:D5 N terminal like [Anaerocolumna jejuensis DSM 15929]|uniref:D5 N terminal like n=1 Tax=Anaerocolumna jejuensis DSM 15929 TaxID=1121322 RepID=A0A1M7ART1_9FIRM|nr:phage/plasmid primase, P4 family [Anaerocolumna jejuensis]SHL45385.1 D5 N terminal like [Anaerocolumna jejuensis DSM 15929]
MMTAYTKTNQEQWEINNYIYQDGDEFSLGTQLLSCAPDTDEFLIKKEMLIKMKLRHRGITKGKKLTLDCVTYAKYLAENRIEAIIVNEKLLLYNLKCGTFDSVPKEFILKIFKDILEECTTNIWAVSLECQYYQAFLYELKSYKKLIPNADRLVFHNGTFNIYKMTLYKHNPKNLALSSLPYNYRSEANCELFLSVLSGIFNGDKEVIASFQEMMGYLLYYGNDYPIQKFFIFYGSGSNGKSVLTRVIRNVLGAENCSATALDDLQERFGKQSIYDKYVNISPEREQKKMFNTAVIKSVTGGDLVEVEKKYEKAYATSIYTKFIVCCNQPIQTDDNSMGYFRRLHIFKFENQYIELKSGEERKEGVLYMDKNLDMKLEQETQGICNWALKGLQRLINNNWEMSPCKAISDLQMQYFLEANPVNHFLKACITKTDTNSEIMTARLFSSYKTWAEKNDISQGAFNTPKTFHAKIREYLRINNLSTNTKKVGGFDYYVGIELNKDWIHKTKYKL